MRGQEGFDDVASNEAEEHWDVTLQDISSSHLQHLQHFAHIGREGGGRETSFFFKKINFFFLLSRICNVKFGLLRGSVVTFPHS